MINQFLSSIEAYGEDIAVITSTNSVSYRQLIAEVQSHKHRFAENGISKGCVVVFCCEWTSRDIAAMLALFALESTVVLVPKGEDSRKSVAISQTPAQFVIDGELEVTNIGGNYSHPLIEELRSKGCPGLVFLTSGSSGVPKTALHDFNKLLSKATNKKGKAFRTVAFMKPDHVGGLNTLLYSLVNGCALICPPNRDPDCICTMIEAHRAELLPASPTFLRLLLLSGAIHQHDLSSLRLVTYGSEPMPDTTLNALNEALPNVEKRQTYGMSEIGIMRSRSRGDGSAFMQIGGSEYQTRIVDGLLEVKADTAMLGYLNAPSPFTEDGWMKTGDQVEIDGDWIRIIGRRSEMINVGGEKVHPGEVEAVIETMPDVRTAIVSGEPNALTGTVLTLKVLVDHDEKLSDFRVRMRKFCAEKLPRHMIPQRVEFLDSSYGDDRTKKIRAA